LPVFLGFVSDIDMLPELALHVGEIVDIVAGCDRSTAAFHFQLSRKGLVDSQPNGRAGINWKTLITIVSVTGFQ